MQKEEAQELTEKLDQEWKSIQALMVKKAPKNSEQADKLEEKPKVRIPNIELLLFPHGPPLISAFYLGFPARGVRHDRPRARLRDEGSALREDEDP